MLLNSPYFQLMHNVQYHHQPSLFLALCDVFMVLVAEIDAGHGMILLFNLLAFAFYVSNHYITYSVAMK